MLSEIPIRGTLADCLAIILGGLCGLLLSKRMKSSIQDSLLKINGLCLIVMGIIGYCEKGVYIDNGHLHSNPTLWLIITLSLGAVIGEIVDIEKGFNTVGDWLKRKTGNQNDSRFVNAFVESSLVVGIGAMSIIGALEEGLHGSPQILFSKSFIDATLVMVFASSMGKGAIFSFVPVLVLQGTITLFAGAIAPFTSPVAFDYVSMVGNIIISGIGINLTFGKKINVANLLPAIILGYIYAIIF